jgi:signal transduction histidine kinase
MYSDGLATARQQPIGWKLMTISYSQLDEPLASEVIALLIDLGVLSRRACQATSEHLEDVANEMLQRLLALCKAGYGAILLREDRTSTGQAELEMHSTAGKAFRALALHNIKAGEIHALLAALPSEERKTDAPASQGTLDETCWLVYRLSLTAGSMDAGGSDEHDSHDRHDGHDGLVPDVSAIFDAYEQPQHVLLVLGWISEQDGECAALISRCHTLLPLVADATASVIAALLLKVQVQQLERKAAREALEGMELLKAELLGTVSHELRSPLASIKGYAATLLRHERRLAREERHQFLLAINEASDRLEVIIERLLELSQLETGQITIKRSSMDVAWLADEAIAAMEERVASTSPGRFVFTLRLEDAGGAPVSTIPLIMADPRRLREVLDNLLENAIKYSPEGGLVIVTIRPVQKMLEVCVADTGQGIPVDHLDLIFDRFHRVDTSLTREVSGLGLGLTICKRIVELHNGTIWAENRPHGKGSAFYVRLPIDDSP